MDAFIVDVIFRLMIKIKTSRALWLLVFTCCMLAFGVKAQTKSTEIKTINGKKYYIHKVEKSQSLYAIARIYGIDVNSILAENDDAIDGLKPGQELKIPFESLLPKQTPSIDTNKYVYHKIAKGETVYAITRKYGIDEKKLQSFNPGMSNGIKEGDYLIVGEKKKSSGNKNSVSTVTIATVSPDEYITHTVSQGETLYGISKRYNVPAETIISFNPEAKDGLKNGQIVKIPVVKKNVTEMNTTSTFTAETNTTTITEIAKPKKDSYEIGLFLPFKLNEAEMLNVDELARTKAPFPNTQSLALDFYAGFKKAVDSLRAKDFEVNIHLFDMEDRDSAKVEALCRSAEFKSLDAIFGPLYLSSFKVVATHAKNNQIPIVSPVIQQNKILYKNNLASKVTPSQYTLIEGLAGFCADSLMASHHLILVNATSKDASYNRAFKDKFNENLLKQNKTLKDSIVEVKGIAGVKGAYKPDKPNVVILFTNNQVYLQDFITQLYVFAGDKKDVTLMGFESVTNIDNLDQEYLNALHYHFASSDHLQYTDSLTAPLVKEYQAIYFSDPSDYYFEAFDIGMYYLGNLKSLGPDIFLKLDQYPASGISIDFKYYRPDAETGFENRGHSIYRYSNYKLQRTGWK